MEFSQRHNMQYFETSALNNHDVERPFEFIADEFARSYQHYIAKKGGEN
jgi:hypothetical protein